MKWLVGYHAQHASEEPSGVGGVVLIGEAMAEDGPGWG